MKKKFLALLLVLVMLCGLLPVGSAAEETLPAADAAIRVSLSKDGAFLKKGETALVWQAVTVKDRNSDGILDIDEALYAAHETFYQGGAASGYATASGQYGLSLTKLWGDTSYNFGYYLNGAMAMGLTDEVKAGDHLEAFIYESAYPDTEGYAKFAQPTADAKVGTALNLTLTYVSGYDDITWAPIFAPLAGAAVTVDGAASGALTDADGKAALTLTEAGTHIISAVKTKTTGTGTVTAISAPVCVVTAAMPDAKITIPSDAVLFVGTKGQVNGKDTHFVAFDEIAPKAVTENTDDGTVTCYFDLTDNKTYNYRVSGPDYVTAAGTFKKTADFVLTVDRTVLQPAGVTKTTVDHDPASNGGCNMADVYLNINAAGYLKLNAVGDSHQLVAIRNWQTVDSVTNNYFIEPDYHYTVLDTDGNAGSGVVTVSDRGLVSAVGEGTAIVLVTYDAINVTPAVGGPFFGAIWPENTGVFVVSVGAGDSGIETGMTLNEGKNTNADTQKMALDAMDAELDVIYFTGSKGSYTFTPVTADCTVSVANPTVDTAMHFTGFTAVAKNGDDSFTVPLTEGRNIVKVEKGGAAEYQIITAKHVSYTVNNGIPVIPGDSISIVFDTLYHPVNKLAGVYNMSALAIYNNVDAFAGKLIGTSSGQYNLASSAAAQTVAGGITKKATSFGVSYTADKTTVLKVPSNWTQSSFRLEDGCFVAVGYGDPFGNHRGITATDGKAPNLNASMKEGILGRLPDITVPVTALEGLIVTTQPAATAYSIGDSFDPTGMVVKAVYTGGVQVEVKNYSFPTEAFDAAGAKQVTITYKQADTTVMTAVNITVGEAELDHIAVTAQPAKTAYQVNENFDDTGMVVTAYYSDSTAKTVTQYTTSHGKLISTDKAVTVTYNGKTAEVPVSVTGRVLSKIAVTAKPSKMTYEVGEYLDPTGMVITATYNDTTTADVTGLVSYATAAFTAVGTNKTSKITYTEAGTTKTVNVTGIKVVEATIPETPEETVTVSFSLLGDDAHDSDTDGSVHTLRGGNLTEWIAPTDITVLASAHVIDVVAKALSSHGIPYSNPSGNYISSIRGLAEFTNGVNSGWMYTLNGEHAELGVAEQTLKNGDVIVLHYTDDYTKEQGSEAWTDADVTGNKTGKTDKSGAKLTVQAAVSGDTATAKVEEKAVAASVEDALKSGGSEIKVEVKDTGAAGIVAVELPRTAVGSIVSDTNAALNVSTDVGSFSIPNDTLAEILKAAGGTSISMTVEKTDTASVKEQLPEAANAEGSVAVSFSITSGDRTISDFGGKALEVSVPVDGSAFVDGKSYVSFVVSDNRPTEQTFAQVQGKTASISMFHFSTVVITKEETAPFTDTVGHWAAEAIAYASANKLMNGVGNGRFDPAGTLDRAMLVTVLYRLEGSPAVNGTNPFSDVADGTWYTDAVLWAAKNGIAAGGGDGRFAPTAPITREQMAQLLFAYAGFKGYDTAKANALTAFTDAAEISPWALNAMQWANAAGLVTGRTATRIAPADTASRAEAATILMRFLESAAK